MNYIAVHDGQKIALSRVGDEIAANIVVRWIEAIVDKIDQIQMGIEMK